MNTMRALSGAVVATALLSGCSMLGGGTENAAVGDTVEVPTSGAKTEGKVAVTLTSLEPAPAKVTKQFEGKPEVWFAEMTFDRDEAEPAEQDWATPWLEVHGYLSDETVIDATFGGADMGSCTIGPDEQEKLTKDYAAGKKIEVCVPVSGDESADFAGVHFGSVGSSSSAVWEK